jgi:hypothetical protein
MNEEIVKGIKASYRVWTEIVPPKQRDKLYIDTPIAFIAVNVETGEEARRQTIVFKHGYTNADLKSQLESFTIAAAKHFED